MTLTATTILLALALVAPARAQQRFESAEAATQALIDAAEAHDGARLTAIFGPLGNEILTSGNPSQDRAEQSEFSKLARAKHELQPDQRNPGRVILSIGDEDWPFPVPIVRSGGKWSFDPSETKVEMLARRIAIEICAGYVQAQRRYASETHNQDGLLEYAAHMVNSPGRHDGLYEDGGTGALVPREFAESVQDGRKKSMKPYHGYYFRILEGQGSHAPGGAHAYLAKNRLIGGFGLVAWPAQYGATGIRTFIVNQDGVVYEKDIPPLPGAVPITRFDPDPSWVRVEETGGGQDSAGR
jgi:hypothetical protein